MTAEPHPPSERSFRSAISSTITVLIVACAVLVGLTFVQGPKLSSATVDTSAVVSQAGAQLRLFANEVVATVDESQVTVAPTTDFTVSTADDVIAVQFDAPLDYGTDYTVTIDDVTSRYNAAGSTFSHTFSTAEASILSLDRADPTVEPGAPDEIVGTALNGGARRVVYSAPQIQSFVQVGDLLAVATLVPDGTSAISLVALGDGGVAVPGVVEQLVLPVAGTVARLASGDPAGYLVFSLSAADAAVTTNVLYAVDLTAAHTIEPVPGLDGQPLVVSDWLMLPGGATAIARSPDETLLRVDLAGGASAVPLGQYSTLSSVSLDGSAIAVGDVFGSLAFVLADGTEQRFQPSPVNGAVPYGGFAQLLGPNSSANGGFDRVQQIASYNPATARFESSVRWDDGSTNRVLYESPDQRGSIERFTLAPNGLYVAVTIDPDVSSSVTDGYAADPESTSVATVIIDIRTGVQVGTVQGSNLIW